MFECGCERGFLVRSTNSQEIVGLTLTHMKTAHDTRGNEKEILAGLKPATP